MKQYDWSKELDSIFDKVETVRKNLEQNLRPVYVSNGLAWDGQIIKNLSGDVHTKVLGAFLGEKLAENGVKADVSYEVVLRPTLLRADIFLNEKVALESKAQGIFSLESLKKRWQKLNEKRADLIHILVSWRDNPSYVRQIRDFISETQTYCFHDLSSHKNQPQELERLTKNVTNWLRKGT